MLDTGWYRATGDWRVSPERFPDGLEKIRRKLHSHGMRLGLWFGPTSAAIRSSQAWSVAVLRFTKTSRQMDVGLWYGS